MGLCSIREHKSKLCEGPNKLCKSIRGDFAFWISIFQELNFAVDEAYTEDVLSSSVGSEDGDVGNLLRCIICGNDPDIIGIPLPS